LKQDRFLLAILIGVGLLVVLALTLFFLRRGSQEYSAEDSPAGVVHNYLLALQNQDYERAYAYLGDTNEIPDFEQFQSDLWQLDQEVNRIAVQIGESNQAGDRVTVEMNLIHPGQGLLAETWTERSAAVLISDSSSAWKIIKIPFPFLVYKPTIPSEKVRP
jgi:hypothetical protein